MQNFAILEAQEEDLLLLCQATQLTVIYFNLRLLIGKATLIIPDNAAHQILQVI